MLFFFFGSFRLSLLSELPCLYFVSYCLLLYLFPTPVGLILFFLFSTKTIQKVLTFNLFAVSLKGIIFP